MSTQSMGDFARASAKISDEAFEILRLQNDAIDAACWDAMRYGLSVHVYPTGVPQYRWDGHLFSMPYIGIALEEGPVQIVWHQP